MRSLQKRLTMAIPALRPNVTLVQILRLRRQGPYAGNGEGVPSRPAFTLLELLIVIAIISLLLAILLPSLSAARVVSKRAECQANLKQLCEAWHMYLDDNEDHFLQGVNANVNYGGRQGATRPFQVPKPLNPYLSLERVVTTGADVFSCPADEGGGPVVGSYYDARGSSYGTNIFLVGPDLAQIPPDEPCQSLFEEINRRLPGLTRSQVTADHSRLALIGDVGWRFTWNRTDTTNRAEWHGARSTHNVGFLDGHVDFVRIHKGMHVMESYVVIPFADLLGPALACQQEVPD